MADQFSVKGIENYLPAYEEVHQWKDRKKKVQVPLFPGYVFVRLRRAYRTSDSSFFKRRAW